MGVTYAVQGIDWLRAHVDHVGVDCLIWPRHRDPNGYGRVPGMLNGRKTILWAHRVMCELVNGPCPPDHEAAHSCGRGKFGCIHPGHLSWKTRSENQLDRALHGTKCTGYKNKATQKLTPDKARQIRALKGTKTQRELAAQFGVTDATIRDVCAGRSWANV